jgi:hypothetical protein
MVMDIKSFEKFLDLSEDERMGLYENYLIQEEAKKKEREQDKITQDLKREKAKAKLSGKIFDKDDVLNAEIARKRLEFIKRPIQYDLTKEEI